MPSSQVTSCLRLEATPASTQPRCASPHPDTFCFSSLMSLRRMHAIWLACLPSPPRTPRVQGARIYSRGARADRYTLPALQRAPLRRAFAAARAPAAASKLRIRQHAWAVTCPWRARRLPRPLPRSCAAPAYCPWARLSDDLQHARAEVGGFHDAQPDGAAH
jgi:hypothetical protein